MKRKTRCLTFLTLCLMLLAVFFSGVVTAASERRTALVIGNSAYSPWPLKNPAKDAAAISARLQELGFTVILKRDANLRVIKDAISDFIDRLKQGGVGLFYYSGQALQVGGVNYLVPVVERIDRESDFKHVAIDLDKVIHEMTNASNGPNIVILDACRGNPYYPGFPNVARGLARISNAPAGMFIAYSIWTNRMVKDEDRDVENSPYTKALLENISKAGLTIHDVFTNVRRKLTEETGQMPLEFSSLDRDFFFVPQPPGIVTAAVPAVKPTMEIDDAKRKLEEEERRISEERALDTEKRALEIARRMAAEEWERLKAEQDRTRQQEMRRLKAEKAFFEAERRQMEAEKKCPPQPAGRETARDGRFIAYKDGTVLDTKTNLMWATKDNGRNIKWAGARSYCMNYRGGGHRDWRMPTQDELAGLYDDDKSYKSKCGDVKLTKLIRLTCGAPWASETRGADAAIFYFYYGSRSWVRQSYSRSARALPVRSCK